MTTQHEVVVPADRIAADPEPATLIALLARAATEFGGREFLRFSAGSMTFAAADELTSRLANHLIDLGIRPGDRVAIMMPNRIGWPLSWLAALKAGAVVVPINSAYMSADLEFVLRDSGAKLVLTVADYRDLVDEVVRMLDTVQGVLDFEDLDEVLATCSSQTPAIDVTADSLANLQYTSGTTGFPKACMLTHDYWVRMGWVAAGMAGLDDQDVVLTAQPFSYIDPQWNTAMCLTAGVPLVVLPKFSASGFWPSVREHRATIFYVLGTMPVLLLKQPPTEDDLDNAVRLVLCSGIPAARHAELEQRWGAPWREAYGMTESGVDLISPVDDVDVVGSGSMGRPVPTKKVRIVDAEGAAVPDGEVGELVVRGKPLMLGYWNQPEVTAQTIRAGWLHTGDLARRDENGRYYLVGRLKDMVRRGGENVSCAEVERALEQHDAVLATAVVPVPDELFGEEVKAFIRLIPGIEPTADTAAEILDDVRTRLARFKVPRFVEFVDEFPMTPSERIAKAKLQARQDHDPGVTFDLQSVR
ncbi:class I adenylate-forming enzyme family protein [Aeromicrobium sp. P5_D10]